MNKQNHQLVFNAARGCIMVVSEAAQRQGKRPGCVTGQRVARSVALAWALTGLGAALVHAQIIADPTAPGQQRPTVLGTPNGAPLVNIQTPSAAGVSRNTYQQFDVGTPGAVLNNSRTNVQSQLGGWVQGNPWLATGEARIILNEVNSQNPSYLNGFIEVAGRRAEVIIANPAGIQVNGAGFINASRATLTTGTPVMSGGNLEGYRVQRGTIRIDGKGLDASLTDYTGVLSRAIEVNAKVHAQQLDMVTGVNEVQAATGEVQSGSAGSTSGQQPSFALDVSELGGMYAGHIRLVGTEAGVGVRHHGTMAASVGDVQVDANGWLSSAGRIEARQGHVRIQTTGTQNHSGVLLAAGNLTLHSGTSADRQAFTHSGQARAGLEAHVRAGDMSNTGQLDAQRLDVEVASLNNRGEIWQTGAQALHVQAGQLSNEAGAVLGQVLEDNSANTPSPDTTTPDTPTTPSGSEAGTDATPTDPNQPAQPDQPAPTQLAAGQVKVAEQLLQEDGAVLASEGDMHLASLQALSNAGDVRVHTLQAQGERFENTAGTVWARNVSIDTQAFEQAQGAQLYGQSVLNLQADTLSNAGLIQSGADAQLEVAQVLSNSGTLAAATDLVLEANDIDNTDGQIVAGRDLQVQAANTLNNTRGVLSAQRQLAVRDAAATLRPQEVQARQLQVVNSQGRIVANSTTDAASSAVDIQAKSLILDDGTLHSGGDMAIDLVGSLHTQSGQNVRAGGDLSVQLHGNGDSTFRNAGQWQAGQNLTVRADHIDNHASGELSSQATTSLSTLQNASGSVTNRGLVDGVDTRAQTHTLTNTGTGRVFGDRVAVAAHTLINREETASDVTKAGTIAARERLDIGAQHITNREGALLFSAVDMAVGGALDGDFRAKTDGSDNAETLNNNSATIESLGDMALATDVLRNTNDHLTWSIEADETTQHREDFSSALYRTYTQTTQKGVVDQSAPGQIVAAGNMELTVQDQGLNQDSLILAGGTISGDVGALENQSTQVSAPTLRSGTTYDWGTVGEDCDFFGSKCDPEYGWRSNPYSETIARQVALPTTRFEQQVSPSGSGHTVSARGSVGSLASAGTTSNPSNPGAAVDASAAPSIVLPGSSLFTIHPASNARYFVETDPRFANYRQWLSSDYLLTASGFKPEDTQKRLGDGFYEQKLIREQVAALTGYRFLGDYRSDEAQYQALMTSGATFAQAHQLRPGIALTGAQVAQLTSDIVWLVTRDVQLPDGSTTTALVPQVYLSPRSGDLAANGYLYGGPNANVGSLISARSIELALSGDLKNSGTVAGRQLLDISAKNIENTGLLRGDVALLQAEEDIDVIGGQVVAQTGLSVQAGEEFTLASTLAEGVGQADKGVFASRQIDRVAGLYVSDAAGVLLASAGGDMNLLAAQVHNAGKGVTQLQAGDKLNLGAVQTGMSTDVTHDAQNYARVQMGQEVGTQISGGGAVNIVAQNDLSARAAMLNAQGALSLQSTDGSVNIEAGQSSEGIQTGSHLQAGGWLASKAVTQTSNTQNTIAQASELGGQSVNISAGQDLRVQGSNVLADEDVVLAAQRDLQIEAAQNSSSSSSFNETKKSGLMSGGGLSVTIGKQVQSLDQGQQQTTAAVSTVGSIGGNVSLTAGQTYTQTGSDVLSPAGNIDINAQAVNITEARETGSQSSEQRFKQSGLTVGLGGGIIDTAQAAIQGLEGVVGGGSKRNQTLNALIAYGKSSDLYEQGKAVQAAAGEKGVSGAAAASGIKVSVSVGSSSSQSNSVTKTNTGAGSTVKAGGSVNIKATGQAEGEGDLTIQGSKVSANDEVNLSAIMDVNILASANTESNRNINKSSSTSVGVSFGVGPGSAGLSLDIAASRGKGQGNSDSITYNNSLIEAGQAVNITSGADTSVVGGNVKAKQVTANVGGDLNIVSVQDTAASKADQKTTGIAVSIPIVGTGGSASLSQNKQSSNSNYASVNEQSGITAGDGGFQLNVGGNTDLKGATIAGSSDASKNTLTTQTLTTSDISNSMNASASSSGTTVGTNMLDGKYALTKAVAGNLLNNGKASQSDASTTTSAISAAQVAVGGKTTDTSKDGLTDSNGKAVSTDTSNTNRTLAKADVAELQKTAQQKQADNMLAFKAATTVSDPINRAMTADKKIVLQTCQADGQCVQKRVNAEDVKMGPDGKVYVFNNGIMNNEAQALDNAAKQSSAQANQEGVYVIINPHTGNVVSEIIYAGIDKLNEMMGGVLPISNAAEANIDLRNTAQTQGGQVVEVNHSRGSLTSSNATAEQINQGIRNAPIESVTFNGAAANAQRMADRVETVTGGTGTVQQSTHKDDLIGTVIGGNAPTGGRDASVGAAHTNYGPGVNEDVKEKVWGNDVGSVPVIVQPTNSQVGAK
jgi:filamentous hemagglutinin